MLFFSAGGVVLICPAPSKIVVCVLFASQFINHVFGNSDSAKLSIEKTKSGIVVYKFLKSVYGVFFGLQPGDSQDRLVVRNKISASVLMDIFI